MHYNSENKIMPDISVTYKTVCGLELPMSVYLPHDFDKAKKYPPVVAIHGGAWHAVSSDSPKWDGGVMRHNAIYYAEREFVSFTISYRSIDASPETTVADLAEDCNDAVEYIKSNFSFADMQRLVLIGDSAGAHLSLSLGMNLSLNPQKRYTEPKIIVACNPVTDCLCERWSFCADTAENRKKLSPMENIKKINSKILLLHGTEDKCVGINDSRKFFEKMRTVGNDIEMRELPNAKHAFILFSYRDTDETVSKTHQIIDEYLNDKL